MTVQYPSIPIPSKDPESMYQTLLLMRQVLTLLTVNIQGVTEQTLTKGAQIFTTRNEHQALVQNITIRSADVSGLQASLSTLQAQINVLQGVVASLQSADDTTLVME